MVDKSRHWFFFLFFRGKNNKNKSLLVGCRQEIWLFSGDFHNILIEIVQILLKNLEKKLECQLCFLSAGLSGIILARWGTHRPRIYWGWSTIIYYPIFCLLLTWLTSCNLTRPLTRLETDWNSASSTSMKSDDAIRFSNGDNSGEKSNAGGGPTMKQFFENFKRTKWVPQQAWQY